ncbi:hypothetical protein KY285_000673 [Solanum tuberosum]|nr:hypothetical protein KY285_000673 [Solanum tuberosum]
MLLVGLLLFPLSAIAQSYQNVSLGSSLTTSDVTSFWSSPSDEFALGFQKIGNESRYLLAIWFNKITDKTIVWSANRNNLALDGSKVQLSADGRLVLTDPNGQEMWARGMANAQLAYGAMLDNGNFVLATSSSDTLWQSFNEPTDTILPGQVLNQDNSLVSSFSDTNVSSGRFEFILQTDGNLVLYTVNYPAEATNLHIGHLCQLAVVIRSQSMYHRAILEYDGVFRHYVHPKSSGREPMAWSSLYNIPDNICLSIRQRTGGGACGFNSLCSIGTDQRLRCDCPLGYILDDPNDKLGSCRQNFSEQNCNHESREVESFTFHEMLDTNWPDSDYESHRDVSEDWCRQSCLNDCFCDVAIYSDDNICWKKRYPLSNGRVGPTIGGKALIKIRKDNSTVGTPNVEIRKKKNQSTLIISGSVLLASSVFMNLFLILLAILYIFKFIGKKRKRTAPYSAVPGVNLRSFSYKELEQATNGFKEELGTGAFSTVYKAVLDDENGKVVAVKKLRNMVTEGEGEEVFEAEVNSISRTNHKNLVQLLGFCNEGQHRLLVYEHMKTGSIANLLFKDSRLSWSKRVQVAIDTAKGLCYLHEECSTQIIHCDIKPQNVLLDENLTAKIADFGMAKLLKKHQTQTTTRIRGTKGYVAPDWFRSMPVTVKVDVYSFGVLLLELICCRKNYEQDVANENEMILLEWAYDCYKRNKLHLLVGDDEEALEDIKRFEKFLLVAIWCIQENLASRPNMKKVMLMLEGSVEVSIPPDPFSFVDSI